MICYLDMTFCNAPCATLSCPRKFTELDRTRSEAWWGDMQGEPPVAFSDFHKTCPDYAPAVEMSP